MFLGLEHTGIASPDPDRLTQWYVDVLGYVVNYHNPVSKTSFVKAANGSMFEIIAADGERAPATLKTPGLRHLAITVDDFPNDYAKLKAAGVEFINEPQVSGGNSVVFFKDPDGNILHLIERTKPLP
ncbi:MAG TPA: VOC family protein [Bryobacteraceae bacterium]